jgi:hypothetical protein
MINDGTHKIANWILNETSIVVELAQPPFGRDVKYLWFTHEGRKLPVTNEEYQRINKFIRRKLPGTQIETTVESDTAVRIRMR